MDLRTVLKMDKPRILYVEGEIKGNEINEIFSGDCQYHIDSSNVPEFNFTLYIMALNSTYTDAVKEAVAADEPFERRNATEYLELLNHQNGWRGTAQNVQKSIESIDTPGNLTLIGFDSSANLNGISLIFNTQSNIIIRNLRMSPPRDCFPSLETYPSSWNARYYAIGFVSTTNAWLDGNILEDNRYDGLFDVEDGSDNITFSHNIVANHHKSLLWGGGEKEGPRDIDKMHFTVFGNHFVNSSSRNPLMRFGTYYVVNNVFNNAQNEPPLYGEKSSDQSLVADMSYVPNFEYNFGIYNMSSLLVSGNYFDQTGSDATDTTRLVTFNDLATPSQPATICSPPDQTSPHLSSLAQPSSALNGASLNLTASIFDTFAYYIDAHTDSVEGGLVESCDNFSAQDMPETFTTTDDVLVYVVRNAGQVGRNVP
ncbi:polysaccharide lyase family 1 protein [Xylaria nigripes]|nr:polysaccharide lyase family 1 protein [Xylaria nigripes]